MIQISNGRTKRGSKFVQMNLYIATTLNIIKSKKLALGTFYLPTSLGKKLCLAWTANDSVKLKISSKRLLRQAKNTEKLSKKFYP